MVELTVTSSIDMPVVITIRTPTHLRDRHASPHGRQTLSIHLLRADDEVKNDDIRIPFDNHL